MLLHESQHPSQSFANTFRLARGSLRTHCTFHHLVAEIRLCIMHIPFHVPESHCFASFLTGLCGSEKAETQHHAAQAIVESNTFDGILSNNEGIEDGVARMLPYGFCLQPVSPPFETNGTILCRSWQCQISLYLQPISVFILLAHIPVLRGFFHLYICVTLLPASLLLR